MNLIDLAVIVVLAMYIVYGIYRGLMGSLLNMCSFVGAWIASSFLYPFLSLIFKHTGFVDTMRFYIEGADRIPTYETRVLDATTVSGDQLQQILDDAMLPAPFNSAVEFNISNHVFAGDPNLVSVGDYLEQTLACVTVNIISFIIIFVIVRMVFMLISNAINYAVPMPTLKKYDGLAGGAVSFIRGLFAMFMLFMFVPIALVALPVEIIVNIVNDSFFSGLFYDASFMLGNIPTII